MESYQYMEILSPDKIAYMYMMKSAKNFGTSFLHTYHKVNLVIGWPYHGCSPLYNSIMVDGSIVLLKKEKCTFVTKSRHAEQAGAIAVIIADNNEANDNEYISMIHDNTGRTVNIPAFFLLGKDGWMIMDTLKNSNQPALVNIPVNITRIPLEQLHFPPWSFW